jgi:hypothetical protein
MAVILQNVIKSVFFVTSGRNSGRIESEFNYKLCKTKPILKGQNERKLSYNKGLWRKIAVLA